MASRLYLAFVVLLLALAGVGVYVWVGIERAEAAQALAMQSRAEAERMRERLAEEASPRAVEAAEAPDARVAEPAAEVADPRLSEVPVDLASRVSLLDTLVDELMTLAEGDGEQAAAAREALGAMIGRIMERDNARRAEDRKRESAEYAATSDARTRAQGWVGDANQLLDPALRETALAEVRAALLSDDEEERLAGVLALAQLGEVEFDRTGLRDPLVAIAREGEGLLLVNALYALAATERRPEDLELALRLADDPSASAGASALHLIAIYADGDLTGEAGAAALALLETRGDQAHLNGLWGTEVSPQIAAWLVEQSRSADHERSHDAIYFGLSTLRDKSPEVVERLIEVLLGPRSSSSGRALWGLSHGVPEESWPAVSEAMRAVFEGRSEDATKRSALRILGSYGDLDDASWLETKALEPALSSSLQGDVQEAIDRIRSR